MAEMEAWITHLLEQDIANLSIHLRTRKEMSKVDAHWEVIPQIMSIRDRVAPQTTITINGDIPDRQKGLELAEQYGVDGIMIGRGFLKILMPLKRTQNTYATRIAGLATFTIDLQDKYAELVPRSIVGPHRFFKIYVKGFPGADLRAQLMNTKSTDEVRQLLATFEAEHGVLD